MDCLSRFFTEENISSGSINTSPKRKQMLWQSSLASSMSRRCRFSESLRNKLRDSFSDSSSGSSPLSAPLWFPETHRFLSLLGLPWRSSVHMLHLLSLWGSQVNSILARGTEDDFLRRYKNLTQRPQTLDGWIASLSSSTLTPKYCFSFGLEVFEDAILPQRRHNFEILLLWASSPISAPWGRHQSDMADIIKSALRIKIPDALFQRLWTPTETCWIESINLGYNARVFATLTKIDKYIKFNNEVEKHTWSRTKIWWTLHFEKESYFNTILGDPRAVSRPGRKGATKVFKHRRKSPWAPTLTGPFPNGPVSAGSWWGTKNAFYYCDPSANSFSRVLFVSSYTMAIMSPQLPSSFTKLVRTRETFIFYFPNYESNYLWVEKRFRCYQQEQFILHWENSVSDGSQCIVNNRKFKMRQRRESKKAIPWQGKTTTLHVHHAFCTFLCRHCTTTWK